MIRLERVTKVFGTVTAVDSVDMEVPAGAVCVLLGPSGCGKTTTMKMINRLIAPSSGKIFIDGQDTAGVDEVTLRRSIGYVIQQIGLFPNKTVEDNICVVPDLLGWPRTKSRKRAAELLEMVNLPPATFLKRYPKELSGGQQQRVALARALAVNPSILLLDEPFAALDEMTRLALNDDLLRLWEAHRPTILFVTHSVFESVYLSTRIAIMSARPGRIAAELEVLLPQPRERSLRADPAYGTMCESVSRTLSDAMSSAAASDAPALPSPASGRG